MAFVPGFEHDVFVSYAHFDNEPDTQEIRWVSRFQADLKVALRQRLGVDPDHLLRQSQPPEPIP